MRSNLRNLLVASLVLAFPLAAGCTGQTFPPGTGIGGSDVDTTTGEFSAIATSGGSGSPMLPDGFWTKRFGDAEDQKAGAMAMNEAGDIALIGSARGTIDLGNVPWTGSTTDSDVFVAKLSREGQSLWSRRYGDSCDQHGSATALAPTGDVLIAGDFCGKMDFGKTAVEAPAGEVDIFVAVIDDVGEDVYSLRIGGAGPQIVRAAAIDAKSNAVLVGSFAEAFDDGSGAVASAGMDDAFVIKLDPTGKVLWSRSFGGAAADIARAVAIDQDGNVIVGGSFEDALDFGGGPVVAPVGYSSAFVTALDPDGKYLWSHVFTGDDEAVVSGLAVNPSGRVAATGTFQGTADFGSGPEPSAGAEDVFLSMINSSGEPIWGRVFGGPKSQIATGVAFGSDGEVAISSTSQELVDFGYESPHDPASPDATNLIYAATLNSNGTVLRVRALWSDAPIDSVGVGLDEKSGSVLVGSFQTKLLILNASFKSPGGWDVFVSRTE